MVFLPSCRSSIFAWLTCALLWAVPPAHADDRAPPWWRDNLGTRFDEWTFSGPQQVGQFPSDRHREGTTPGQMAPPDRQSSSRWEDGFGGRKGVWRLDDQDRGVLTFVIPNQPDPKALYKAVLVQVTYLRTGDKDPRVEVVGLDDLGNQTPMDEAHRREEVLDDGWRHLRLGFMTKAGCPDAENVRVRPPENGTIYVDQVVIDAKCEQPPFVQPAPAPKPPAKGSGAKGSSGGQSSLIAPMGWLALGIALGALLAFVIMRRR